MKNIVKLPIVSSFKTIVKEGEKITPKTPIFIKKKEKSEEVLPLSNLLSVSPSKIAKYLKKKIGEEISKGEVLAQKRGFFSSLNVKSPINGKIKEIDIKKGTLSISFQEEDENKVYLPVSGHVSRVTSEAVELEVMGQVVTGQKGEGEDILGTFVFFKKEEVGLFDIDIDIEPSIIFCHTTNIDAIIKAEALGVNGVILVKPLKGIDLPYILVDEKTSEHLEQFSGYKVWLRPSEKEIIILDKE